MPKLSPEEILRRLEDSEMDDEMDRVLAMTPEDRRRELEARGVDLHRLDARAETLQRALGLGDDGASVEQTALAARRPPASRIPRKRAILLGAAAALAIAAGLFALVRFPTRDVASASLDAASSAPSTPPAQDSAPEGPGRQP